MSLQLRLSKAYMGVGSDPENRVSLTAAESTLERERAELQAVLGSAPFARAPTLAHLLSYLCEKMLAGEGDHIKEYSIAVDVFGRRDTFDQDVDSIVRVQANRLRKRLAEYYAGEGAGHRLRIIIPVGQYVPAFREEAVASCPLDEEQSEEAATVAPGAPRIALRLGAIGLVALLAGAGFLVWHRSESHSASTSTPRAVTTDETSVGLPVGDEVRILAGATHNFVDRSGKVWSADAYFTGGSVVRAGAAYIRRTMDPTIYRVSRQGDFRYDIPLKPGTYELHLHFAETFYGPEDSGGGEGSRVMAVTVNGKASLTDFDVLADADGARVADVRVFTEVHPAEDGVLHLNFSSVKGGRAMVSAIEVLPGVPGQLRPVRIVTRDVPYYSDDSRWWSADSYFQGGQLRSTEQVVAVGTDDPELYATERWGHFSYAIPVAPGKYALTFYFIERRFGADGGRGDASDSSGVRLFDVFVNRKLLLHSLNILKEVGENRPLVRKFTGLEPNAQGKLLVEFVPARDYATVSAIEVVSQ